MVRYDTLQMSVYNQYVEVVKDERTTVLPTKAVKVSNAVRRITVLGYTVEGHASYLSAVRLPNQAQIDWFCL
jgi:hypothetical protein